MICEHPVFEGSLQSYSTMVLFPHRDRNMQNESNLLRIAESRSVKWIVPRKLLNGSEFFHFAFILTCGLKCSHYSSMGFYEYVWYLQKRLMYSMKNCLCFSLTKLQQKSKNIVNYLKNYVVRNTCTINLIAQIICALIKQIFFKKLSI